MKTIVAVNLALISVLVVAGKKFEATEGQNVTIYFDIDEVEKADHARITFKEDKKEYSVLLAQKPWVYDDPQDPAVTLILGEGCFSVIIQNISISRSGLYKAETFTREKVSETATLVVNIDAEGSKIVADHGENVTLSFPLEKAEEADRLRISFFKEGSTKLSFLISQNCALHEGCDDVHTPGVSVLVAGECVRVTVQNVDISRSGRYKAEAYFREKVFEEYATLVVNKAPVSSTTSPPHSSSCPKPPRSADLHWLYALITAVFIIICISFFCRWRTIPCFKREKESETSSSDRVSVNMNGCGENTEALLTDTRVPYNMK